MKFLYPRAALVIGLGLPLYAHAYRSGRGRGGHVVVTVHEEVLVTSTVAPVVITQAQNGVALPSPSPSATESVEPSENPASDHDQHAAEPALPSPPAPSPPENKNVANEASTPTAEQADGGSRGGSLTISITNLYGTPLSIGLGSNYGGPTPDGNPQPTTIASSMRYTFPVGWAGRITVGKSLSGCNSLIEASYEPQGPRAVDVSYVDGYSVPITCSVDGKAVTGCNIELFDQGLQCDTALDHGACPNSARPRDNGPPPAFFEACQGSAYTFPKDDVATFYGVTGLEISCCIGTACPAPPLQKSQKRDVMGAPIAQRGLNSDRSQHVHQHQERHRWISPRSHVHQLVQDAKMRR
jgi:hypothetical protein